MAGENKMGTMPEGRLIVTMSFPIMLSMLVQELGRAGLVPVGAVLDQVAPIDYTDFIPEDSVLHEFIG